MRTTGAALKETVVHFGEASHLVGVLTRADAGPGSEAGAPAARVGVLLLNAGVIGRMGPHRFNVKIGRAMARLGHPVLRFDLSGMGDSGRAPEARSHAQQVVQDISAAIDVLGRETDHGSVLIVGICSGANQAWHAALDDRRIDGLVMIDSFAYPNSRTALQYHLLRMRWRTLPEIMSIARHALLAAPARAWTGLKSMGLNKLSKRYADPQGAPALTPVSDENSKPSVTDYAMHMQSLIDRNVRVLLIYTGTWARYYSYPGQFADTFGRYSFASKCEFIPQFDHTFTLVSAQQGMIGRIAQWTRDQYQCLSRSAVPAEAPTTSPAPTEVEGPRSSVREPYPPMLAD